MSSPEGTVNKGEPWAEVRPQTQRQDPPRHSESSLAMLSPTTKNMAAIESICVKMAMRPFTEVCHHLQFMMKKETWGHKWLLFHSTCPLPPHTAIADLKPRKPLPPKTRSVPLFVEMQRWWSDGHEYYRCKVISTENWYPCQAISKEIKQVKRKRRQKCYTAPKRESPSSDSFLISKSQGCILDVRVLSFHFLPLSPFAS